MNSKNSKYSNSMNKILKYPFDSTYRKYLSLHIIEQFYNFVVILKMIGIPTCRYQRQDKQDQRKLDEIFQQANKQYQHFEQLICKKLAIVGKLIEVENTQDQKAIMQILLLDQYNQAQIFQIKLQIEIPKWMKSQIKNKKLIFTEMKMIKREKQVVFAFHQGKVYEIQSARTQQDLAFIGSFINYQFSKFRLDLTQFGYHQQKDFLRIYQNPLRFKQIKSSQEKAEMKKKIIDFKYPKKLHTLFGVIYSTCQTKVVLNGSPYNKVSVFLLDPIKRKNPTQIGITMKLYLYFRDKVYISNSELKRGDLYMFRQTQFARSSPNAGFSLQYVMFLIEDLHLRKIIKLSSQQFNHSIPYYTNDLALSDMSTYYAGVMNQNIIKLRVSLRLVQYVSGKLVCSECQSNIHKRQSKLKFTNLTRCLKPKCDSNQIYLSLTSRAYCQDQFSVGVFKFNHKQTLQFLQLNNQQISLIQNFLYENQKQSTGRQEQHEKLMTIYAKTYMSSDEQSETEIGNQKRIQNKQINQIFQRKYITPKQVIGYARMKKKINPNFFNASIEKEQQENNQSFYNGFIKRSIKFMQSLKTAEKQKCSYVYFDVLEVKEQQQEQFNRCSKPSQMCKQQAEEKLNTYDKINTIVPFELENCNQNSLSEPIKQKVNQNLSEKVKDSQTSRKSRGIRNRTIRIQKELKMIRNRPRCLACGGRLGYDYENGIYYCYGYNQDDYCFTHCIQEFKQQEIERAKQ